jgi:hypothetical protein
MDYLLKSNLAQPSPIQFVVKGEEPRHQHDKNKAAIPRVKEWFVIDLL